MSRNPRQPLTNEEAALAARLPPLHGPVEPGAMLDARILAAAHAAVTAQHPPGPRIRWLAPLAVAASLSLAVGLAWRLGPPVTPVADAPSAAATMEQLPESRMMEPPNDARDPPLPPTVQPALRSQAASKPAADARAPEDQAQATALPASPAAPQPPPAAPAAVAAAADMGAAPDVALASTSSMTKSVAGMDATPERAAAAAPGTQANEAERAAAARSGAPLVHDDGFGEDVPPATVDSPVARRAWLRRIGELLQEGRVDDAKASLAEFRRRYPDAPLPPDLRALEP